MCVSRWMYICISILTHARAHIFVLYNVYDFCEGCVFYIMNGAYRSNYKQC